jgi:hypothetical protein
MTLSGPASGALVAARAGSAELRFDACLTAPSTSFCSILEEF